MFQIKDAVIYGKEGICVIEEICEKDFSGMKREYYVLRPVYQSASTIYIPVDNEKTTSRMRKLLSEEEIRSLIYNMPKVEVDWISNDSTRKEKYNDILRKGSREELIALIRSIYIHKQEVAEKGKKLHIADENAMKEAEKMLYDEFAYVLNIDRTEVLKFIIDQIEEK